MPRMLPVETLAHTDTVLVLPKVLDEVSLRLANQAEAAPGKDILVS